MTEGDYPGIVTAQSPVDTVAVFRDGWGEVAAYGFGHAEFMTSVWTTAINADNTIIPAKIERIVTCLLIAPPTSDRKRSGIFIRVLLFALRISAIQFVTSTVHDAISRHAGRMDCE